MSPLRLFAACLCVAVAPLMLAADPDPDPSASPEAIPKPRAVVTHGATHVHGHALAYTATAGTLLLYNDKREATGQIFYVAYTADGPKRPVTFCYNGGPGSSSIWLHMGAFGPKRVNVPSA